MNKKIILSILFLSFQLIGNENNISTTNSNEINNEIQKILSEIRDAKKEFSNNNIGNEKIDEKVINKKYSKRNPFESLITQRKKIEKYNEIENAEQIEKTPLIQRYDLTKYLIKGYIYTQDKKIILVEEKYSNKKFYLKLFDFIGNQKEQIIELSKNSIILGKFDEEKMMFVKTNIININKKQ